MVTATLTATHDDDTIELALAIENDGAEPLELTFHDGQRAEFVARADDEEVWRWSDGRMFTQAIETVTLDPGAETAFEAGWPDPPSGEYTVTGWTTAQALDVSAEATVSV